MNIKGSQGYNLAVSMLRFQRTNRAIFIGILKPFKLNFNEWLLLSLICNSPEDSLDMNKLSELLDFGKPHVTALFSGLQKAALAEQSPDSNDKRRKVVRATKYGKGQLQGAEAAIDDGLKNWFIAVADDELAVFLNVINLLSNNQNKLALS